MEPVKYIVCAAFRHKVANRIICAPRHGDKLMRDQMICSEGRDFWKNGSYDQGFVDQFGTFYDREQAWELTERNGQRRREFECMSNTLLDSHLY